MVHNHLYWQPVMLKISFKLCGRIFLPFLICTDTESAEVEGGACMLPLNNFELFNMGDSKLFCPD